jgi:hypothetical protein
VRRPIPRRAVLAAVAFVVLGAGPSLYMRLSSGFPPDTTPEGAYARIVLAVTEDRMKDAFAYLETEAQWSLISLYDYRKRAHALVLSSYPESERAALLATYETAASSQSEEEFFAREAKARGFTARLRRDLSGPVRTEIQGERATVETARGTRYPFRRRENGIWGLTLFTAELRADAERAALDYAVVQRAAADYSGKPAPVPHD